MLMMKSIKEKVIGRRWRQGGVLMVVVAATEGAKK